MRRRPLVLPAALGLAVVLCLLLTIVYPSYLNFSPVLVLLPPQSSRRGAWADAPPLLSPTTPFPDTSLITDTLSDADRLQLFAVREVRIECPVAFVVSCSFYCNPPLVPHPTVQLLVQPLSHSHSSDARPPSPTGHKLCPCSRSITSTSGQQANRLPQIWLGFASVEIAAWRLRHHASHRPNASSPPRHTTDDRTQSSVGQLSADKDRPVAIVMTGGHDEKHLQRRRNVKMTWVGDWRQQQRVSGSMMVARTNCHKRRHHLRSPAPPPPNPTTPRHLEHSSRAGAEVGRILCNDRARCPARTLHEHRLCRRAAQRCTAAAEEPRHVRSRVSRLLA
jgi:hypothetical protein